MKRIVRGSILHFVADPATASAGAAWRYWDDGALIVEDGKVARVTDHMALQPADMAAAAIDDYTGKVIMPGFVDAHIHYAQVDVIASYGTQLLDWLERYTFPAERKFADPAHAAAIAEFFLDELLRNGTTTAAVFPTVHKASVDAFFAAAQKRKLRMLAGKVMMDRNCPDFVRDDVESAEADNRELIARWHNKDRLTYTLTPRFAPTSTPAQLALTAQLMREFPDLHMQTHLAENRDEIRWVRELFPDAAGYYDVYAKIGLTGARSLFAHCVHMSDAEFALMAAAGDSIAFCPTSNLFVGSGLFDLKRARAAGVRVGMGTDVGGGTSYSMLRTLAEAYKVLQLNGINLDPMRAFHLATLGGADALGVAEKIGNFAAGKEADFVVLDLAATPVLARRTSIAGTLEERLFALMTLGDDRSVFATHILGEPAYRRDAA
ncbi:MAG TPA: guanine deaminase [Magnetospirillaceae bacterium]|jgi:guanine deaminase